MAYQFVWDDGVQTQFVDPLFIPTVEEPLEIPGQILRTLDNGAVWLTVVGASGETLAPKTYVLKWAITNPDFLAVAKATFENKRKVTVLIPNRIDATAADRWEPVSIAGQVTVFKPMPHDSIGRQTSLEIVISEVRLA